MCVSYSLQVDTDPVFFITDIMLPPLIFGIGFIGCLLLLMVLSCRQLRRESSIYIYLSGLAVADLFLLCSTVPRFVRSVEVLSLDAAFSRQMAYALWIEAGLSQICRQAAIWLTGLTVAVRYAGTRWPLSPSKWTRISLSRVLVLLVFLFCILLNFTRFLDSEVVEMTGHCFEPMSLWTQNVTRFGANPIYRELHPVIVCFFGHVIPLTVTLLFVLLLGCTSNFCSRNRRGTHIILRTPKTRDESESLVTTFVLALSIALLVLETPSVTFSVFEACFENALNNSFRHYFHLIARCFSLIRCSVGFILMVLINHDFRKTCRRTCCCCCAREDDEFFEPVTCCLCLRKRQDVDAVDGGTDTKNSRVGSSKKAAPQGGIDEARSRRPVVDNVYDDVFALKRDYLPSLSEDKELWI